jgi:protein SCO1/2
MIRCCALRAAIAALILIYAVQTATAQPNTNEGAGQSSHCARMSKPQEHYTRHLVDYAVPAISLVDQNGKDVSIAALLDDTENPIALNFIFTTCTTICPVMTATFTRLAAELNDDERLRLVSVSIDPEYDTPDVLKSYARQHGVSERQTLLTGDNASVGTLLRSFDALFGSKMNHRPLTYFRIPGADGWLRIEGLVGAGDLVSEYRRLMAE